MVISFLFNILFSFNVSFVKYNNCCDDVISIEQFLFSPKIFVLITILSLSLIVLNGIAISADVNLSLF